MAEQAALAAEAHEPDFPTLQAKFKARVAESAARVRAAKERVGSPASFAGQGEARAVSKDIVGEYQRLTR